MPADGESKILKATEFVVWQLIDSAFPTGGFAHSSGLEAAWLHGEVRGRTEVISFLESGLNQVGWAGLPLATAAFVEPGRLVDFDSLCEAFTSNHVANRASRAQGRALLMAVERIFQPAGKFTETSVVYGHFAPVFGACMGRLKISRDTMGRMFLFNHMRSVLAAAVRLNIVGPMEAQVLQHRLGPQVEEVLRQCGNLGIEDLAQTAPLLEIWQGAQDRLYSRLFQS